mmetsp:Transcript_38475/g.104215  ORF Transcript_38475/g.104215 Transcript_38475/m.104215 type:complete len:210 (-) Transcript_38475:43-672(-)
MQKPCPQHPFRRLPLCFGVVAPYTSCGTSVAVTSSTPSAASCKAARSGSTEDEVAAFAKAASAASARRSIRSNFVASVVTILSQSDVCSPSEDCTIFSQPWTGLLTEAPSSAAGGAPALPAAASVAGGSASGGTTSVLGSSGFFFSVSSLRATWALLSRRVGGPARSAGPVAAGGRTGAAEGAAALFCLHPHAPILPSRTAADGMQRGK